MLSGDSTEMVLEGEEWRGEKKKQSKRRVEVMQEDRGEKGKSSYSLLSHNRLACVTRHFDSSIHSPPVEFF